MEFEALLSNEQRTMQQNTAKHFERFAVKV